MQKTERHLSRRERQIMDVVYAKGQASVAEVLEGLPDPPSYSSIRALMRILEHKGLLKHKELGIKYIYSPTRPRRQAARAAVRNLIRTFFDGSTEKAVAALLDASDSKLTDDELHRLRELFNRAGKAKR